MIANERRGAGEVAATLMQAEKVLLGVGEGERLEEEQIPSLEDLIASAQKSPGGE